AKMNNWDPNSEVSQFNATHSTAPVSISAEFAQVMAEADRIHDLTSGAFDVTLAPLIELWGFGAKEPGEPIPSQAEIDTALSHMGQSEKIRLTDTSLQKTEADVSVQLAAIAKGYGVDAIANALAALGSENHLVEIGGDLFAAGLNDKGKPWVIGVERPDALGGLQTIVPVSGYGMATSGDYRNYFEEDGICYSHIIDPTTGRPVTHKTASVTVLAPSAMSADGLATALLVVDGDKALDIARENDIAVLLIQRKGSGFVTETSPAFDALIAEFNN
ncbi:MAG: FAD:protein FMN transferase, partial [Mangrovicoccus sp.]